MASTVVTSLRWWRWAWVGEVAVAVIATTVMVTDVTSKNPEIAYELAEPNGWLILLALMSGLPLLGRRVWPLPSLAISTGAVFTLGALHANAGAGLFCEMLGLYTLASWGTRRAAVAGLLFVNASLAGLAVLKVPYFDHPLALMSPLCATVAWAIGLVMRRQRLNRDQAVAAALEAQRARAQAAEKAVFAERLRLAGELHEVVSRDLTVISILAAQLREHHKSRSRQLRAALQIIEDASRAALDDLRRMLGLLRTTDDPPASAAATADSQLQPLPRGWRGLRVDILIAIGLAVVSLINAYVRDPSLITPTAQPNAVLVGLILAATLPLSVRRRWPTAVFAICLASSLIIMASGWRADEAGFCSLVALFGVARWQKLWIAIVCTGLVWAGPVAVLLAGGRPLNPGEDLFGVPLLIPAVLGLVMKQWRKSQQAALAAALESEYAAAANAQQAVLAERLRIAREMHDVVSHTLSVIAVQAGTARYLLDSQPHLATPAVAAIEQASRAALDDLRAMRAVLRSGSDEQSTLGPAPRLTDLPALIASHEAVHGPVTLVADPNIADAPLSVQMTAYRLVQEALTNIRKHAPGASAGITLSTDGHDIVIEIENTATVDAVGAMAHEGGGHGLAGMNERVALYRGTIRANRTSTGGFRVHATLPGVVSEHA